MRNYVDLKDNKKKLGSYIFTLNSFLWIVSLCLLILSISPIGKFFLSKIIDFNRVPFYPHVIIAIIVGIIEIFILLSRNYYQTIQKYKKIGVNSVISFVITCIVAISLIYFLDFGALGKLMGRLVGAIYLFFSILVIFVMQILILIMLN
ncbi:MAG: hypothetical protein FXF47_10150 [Candidatus Mcinerneyibacterium aminivorans]|uniref:Uncharacterized protein n=1 Tax=Candidatus Mcinerneyibacterium aminivorans TaxID=2703815 RepID=A0A5D0M986_9BACT|nr:MAG: hypothetical protein FXF47_10150 [Candidatus Mcinerneyibacterium aminivorans]